MASPDVITPPNVSTEDEFTQWRLTAGSELEGLWQPQEVVALSTDIRPSGRGDRA
jgi:hypothetical protein